MTRDGIHTFIAFCESNKLWKFDAKQMKSVWVTIVSKEMMRDIKFLLIGLADELRGTDDWERIYQYWVKGGWMNGKSSTATFAEMATFAKDKLLNRLQHCQHQEFILSCKSEYVFPPSQRHGKGRGIAYYLGVRGCRKRRQRGTCKPPQSAQN